jgi:hypothetical protein
MLTSEHPLFFSLLSGSNAPLYEKIIVRLYDEMFRGSAGDILTNREYIRALVEGETTTFDMQRKDEPETETLSSRVSQNIARMIDTGWMEIKNDSFIMDHIYSFTKNGRKTAQLLHGLNMQRLTTRQRNVRSTHHALLNYLSNPEEPFDLIDAEEYSDYIVSDIMDLINEINDQRKLMVQKAMLSVHGAGESFFEFLDRDFTEIKTHLVDDSITRYRSSIIETLNNLIADSEGMRRRNSILKTQYPALADAIDPVGDILNRIGNRIDNAAEVNIPELISALKALFYSSEMVLRQASAISAQSDEEVLHFIADIKAAPQEEKNVLIEAFGAHLNVPGVKIIDPGQITLKKRKQREAVRTVLAEETEPNEEVLRQSELRRAFRSLISCTSADALKHIRQLSDKNEGILVNGYMPIESYKDLLISLIAPAVAVRDGGYNVTFTGKQIRNKYVEIDEVVIVKKQEDL